MADRLHGIHHITAISSDAQGGIDFYTRVLGLRLVKITVNYDDPATYHLYFGDALGTPGSILTFFPFAGAGAGKVGTGQVSAIAFSIRRASVPFWAERLSRAGIAFDGPFERFGYETLSFRDYDGLPLELVADDSAIGAVWRTGSVAAEHAITRFHGVTLRLSEFEATARLLQDKLGFAAGPSNEDRRRFAVGEGNKAQFVDLLVQPGSSRGLPGAGTVHHIAWRCLDRDQAAWRSLIAADGYNVTPIIDRNYFHSIYFREPGGVLFEVATDEPGFTVDQSEAELGTRLALPSWLEPRRESIEMRLSPVKLPGV